MRGYCVFIVIFITFLFSFSQEDNGPFRNLSVKNDLNSSSVYFSMKDHAGNIWLSTDMGITVFNGERFDTLNGNSQISNKTFFKTFEDEKNRIWLLPFSNELFYYQNDSLYQYKHNTKIQQFISKHYGLKNSPKKSFSVSNDTVLIEYRTSEVIQVNPDGEVCFYQPSGLRNENFFQERNNNDVVQQASWFSVNEDGIYDKKKRVNDRDFYLLYDNHKIKLDRLCGNKRSYPIYSDNNYKTIAIGYYQSLLLHDKATKKTKEIKIDLPKPAYITAIALDSQSHQCWVGTTNNGVFVYQLNNETASLIKKYVHSSTVSSILLEDNGGTWLTTIESGVFYLPYRQIEYYNKSEGLSHKYVKELFFYNEQLLIAGANGAIDVLNDNELRPWKRLSASKIGGLDCLDTLDKKLFIGARNSFLVSEKHIKKMSRLAATKQIIRIDDTSSLVLVSKRLLIVNHNKQYAEQEIKTMRPHSAVKRNDTIFIACKEGLYTFSNKKLKKVKEVNDDIRDIRVWRDGFICNSKSNGLFFYKNHQKHKLPILNKTVIRDVLIKDNNIWLASNKGLQKLTITHEDTTLSFISEDSGLPTNEINTLCFFENNIWVGSSNGLSRVPKDFLFESNNPDIQIRSISVNDKKVNNHDKLNLNWNENFVEILVEGNNFKYEKSVKYQYQVTEWGSKWYEANQGLIRLGKLDNGEYHLSFRAILPNGATSQQLKALAIHITPPFWETWWFYTILTSTVLGSGYYYFKRRERIIKERFELEQKALKSEKKAIEESEKALRAQMNPHLVFNTLNNINYLISKEKLTEAKNAVHKMARLIRSVLNSSRQPFIELEEEIDFLKDYTDLQQLQHQKEFDFEIICPEEMLDEEWLVPPMIIQPFIENAIIHGITPLKDKKGVILVIFEMFIDEKIIKCTVRDNGVGRGHHKEKRKTHKNHRSVGLSVTKERLEALLKDSELNVSPIQFSDLEEGTKVEIYIPIK